MLLTNSKKIAKRILCGFVAAAVLSSSTVIFAREEMPLRRPTESVITITGRVSLYDDLEPLFPLSLKPDNTFEGETYYTQLDEVSADIYDLLYSSYKDGGHGNEIDVYPILEEHDKIEYEDLDALRNDINSHVYSAFLALAADHPELSWVSFNRYGAPISYFQYEGYVKIATANFKLIDGYNYGTPEEIDSAVKTAKEEIEPGSSRYDLVMSIHDYICDLTDYNYTAILGDEELPEGYDTGWYQTCYSAFYPIASNNETEISTVCAGYSTSFKVLCNAYGIPCITVRGKTSSGENHMWNYVQMEDKQWYAVDATWDDQTATVGKIYYDNFLVGANTPTESFGLTFSERHISSGYWESRNRYLFAYPDLSDDEYEPSENNEDKVELTDEENKTGVVVIADKEVLEEGTVLNVEKKSDEQSDPDGVTYDITLTLNGEKVQPDGDVTVKIPVPDGIDEATCKVYYRDLSDGKEKFVDMEAVVENGFLVFTTDHFSEYVVTAKDLTAPKGMLGDVFKDDKIDIKDARKLLQAVSGNIQLTAEEEAVADVYEDGSIDIRDARMLLQAASGSIEL